MCTMCVTTSHHIMVGPLSAESGPQPCCQQTHQEHRDPHYPASTHIPDIKTRDLGLRTLREPLMLPKLRALGEGDMTERTVTKRRQELILPRPGYDQGELEGKRNEAPVRQAVRGTSLLYQSHSPEGTLGNGSLWSNSAGQGGRLRGTCPGDTGVSGRSRVKSFSRK